MIPRGTTPLRGAIPSLEASNQSQIDDLVQRNRTLEHTVKKLTDKMTQETTKSREAMADIHNKWQLEQSEWRQGCDILQSCHRVVQLRNLVELEKGRMQVLKELDVARVEKLKRLQRDFRITMFQARETELEEQILELTEQRDATMVEYEENMRRWKGKHSEYVAQIRAKEDQLAVVELEKEELQEKLVELQEENANLLSHTESLNSKLERATLQLEGAQTKQTDLERTNEELKHTNADLHRQLEKWQKLETKGGTEVETQRKKRIELEVHVKELEMRLEKNAEENEKALEKEKRKVNRLKEGIVEWQTESQKHEQEGEDARKQLSKVQKQLDRLKAELDIERAQVRPLSEKGRSPSPLIVEEDEVPVAQNSVRPERPKPRPKRAQPASRARRTAEPENAEAGPSGARDEDHEIVERSKPKERATPVSKADSNIEEDSKKVRTKAKVNGKAKAVEETNGEVEIVAPQNLPTEKRGAKRKATRDKDGDTDIEVVENRPGPKSKKGTRTKRAESELGDLHVKAKPVKDTGRARSIQRRVEGGDEETEQNSDGDKDMIPKKKRRKINIFPTNVEPTAFTFIPNIEGGLDIPTVLSPVKESDGIPSRSTSGSVLGNIGSMLRNSFTRR